MGAVTFKDRAFQARVDELCREIINDPERANFAKPRTMKKQMRDDFPDLSDSQLGNNVGRVLQRLDYAEKWGGETYQLDAEAM